VVDDSKNIQRQINSLLTREGYKVSLFDDGYHALSTLSDSSVDLFMLDINMPNIDGLDLCRLIRMSKIHVNTNIILLTSKQGEYERCQAELNGANTYITKPYTNDDILNAITAVTKKI